MAVPQATISFPCAIGNNSQGIWQFLSRMNGGKANTNMPFAGARRSGAGGRNTLEDFLTGHRKNSYGVEGMRITANSRRIIKVSSAKISSSTSDGIGLPCVQPGTFSFTALATFLPMLISNDRNDTAP